MKITKYNTNGICFSDGSIIEDYHEQDCCEYNYADFSVLEVFYHDEEFESYEIEPVYGAGFNLILITNEPHQFEEGNLKHIIFIPCYSVQNGYYSTDLEISIYKDGKAVKSIYLNCEFVDG